MEDWGGRRFFCYCLGNVYSVVQFLNLNQIFFIFDYFAGYIHNK